jgi:hypothetical protein
LGDAQVIVGPAKLTASSSQTAVGEEGQWRQPAQNTVSKEAVVKVNSRKGCELEQAGRQAGGKHFVDTLRCCIRAAGRGRACSNPVTEGATAHGEQTGG